jgi:hypothetical protein
MDTLVVFQNMAREYPNLRDPNTTLPELRRLHTALGKELETTNNFLLLKNYGVTGLLLRNIFNERPPSFVSYKTIPNSMHWDTMTWENVFVWWREPWTWPCMKIIFRVNPYRPPKYVERVPDAICTQKGFIRMFEMMDRNQEDDGLVKAFVDSIQFVKIAKETTSMWKDPRFRDIILRHDIPLSKESEVDMNDLPPELQEHMAKRKRAKIHHVACGGPQQRE